MNKYKKLIADDATKRGLVLEILKLLGGESYNDCKEILEITGAFLKENAYLDFELAKELINSGVEGD